MEYQSTLDEIVTLVRQVGAYQRENLFRTDLRIDTKSNETDLVTEVDKQSDKLISDYIKAHFPDHTLLTEESGVTPGQSDYRWVVDPLDGTTNFAQGLPIFCISVALQYRGETVLGVIYESVMDELFTAIRGQGAFRNGERMEVSQKDTLRSAVLSTGFPYDLAEHPVNNLSYFCALSPQVRAVRRLGAAAYDLALVAGGRLDGHWELGLHIWDIAAGVLLVEEAGGKVVSFREDRPIAIVASNKTLCGAILGALRAADGQAVAR